MAWTSHPILFFWQYQQNHALQTITVITSVQNNLAKGHITTLLGGEWMHPLHALAVGEQCAAPTVDMCKHSATHTLPPRCIVPILYSGLAFVSPQNFLIPGGIWTPPNTWVFGPTWVCATDSIPSHFCWAQVVPSTCEICNSSLHLCSVCGWHRPIMY